MRGYSLPIEVKLIYLNITKPKEFNEVEKELADLFTNHWVVEETIAFESFVIFRLEKLI